MTLTQITKIRGTGIHTTSNIVSHNINSSGIITAVAFKGPFTGSSNIQSGILTATKIDLNGDIDVDGHTNLDNVSIAGVTTTAGLLDINAGGRANTFKVEDLTDNRVVIAGTGGELESSTILTDNGSTLAVTGGITATTGTFSGNVSIGGTLTYEDVTNVDAVGVITARSGVDVDDFISVGSNIHLGNAGIITAKGADINGDLDVDGHTNLDNVSVAGVSTFSEDVKFTGATSGRDILWDKSANRLEFANNAIASWGSSADLRIYHDTNHSYVSDYGTGNLNITGSRVNINNADNTKTIARFDNSIGAKLFWDNSPKFETTNTGVVVTGILTATSDIKTTANLYAAQGHFTDHIYIADTIVHTGDTNTKIRFPTNDTVTVETAGDERLRITSAGLVGIGTDNPVGNLEVRDTKANLIVAKDGLTVKSNSDIAAQYDLIQIGAGGALCSYSTATATADTQFIHNAYRHSSGPFKYRYADTAARLRVNSPGRTWIFESAASGSADSTISWVEQLRIKSSGEVRIGDNSTTASTAGDDLVIEGSSDRGISIISGSSSSANIYFGDSGDADIGRIAYQHNDNALDFSVNAGSTALRIDSNGDIRINQPAEASGRLTIKGTNSNGSSAWAVSDSGKAREGLDITCTTVGDGNFGGAISFGCGGNGRSAIAAVQVGSDDDVNGLAFFTHGSNNGSDNTVERLRITSGGNVNIGGNYTQTTYTMRVTGSFAATTKSFVIDHPTKENHKLRYACLEGPENSVYVRGRSSDSIIELPDYWVGLVHDDSITVNVTPIGNKNVWVESINNNSVTIGSDDSTEYFYTVFAERKDVEKLEVEVEK